MKKQIRSQSDIPQIVALMDQLIESMMLQCKGMNIEVTSSYAAVTFQGKKHQSPYRSIEYEGNTCIITGADGEKTILHKDETGIWIEGTWKDSENKSAKLFFSKRKAA